MEALLDWMAANPQVWAWFTTAVRFLFPVLALLDSHTDDPLPAHRALSAGGVGLPGPAQRGAGAGCPLGEHSRPGRQLPT